jgi:hypothetical protein
MTTKTEDSAACGQTRFHKVEIKAVAGQAIAAGWHNSGTIDVPSPDGFRRTQIGLQAISHCEIAVVIQ